MRNMVLIILNILKSTFRKKGNIIIYLFLPLFGVLLSLLIYGNLSPAVLKIGIENNDNGILSKDMRTALEEVGNFRLSDVKEEEISQKLLNMELDAVVDIPAGYTESIYSGKPEKITVTSLKGQETTVWIKQSLNSYTDILSKLSAASGGNHAVFDKLYGQYAANQTRFSVVKVDDKRAVKYMTLSSIGFLIMFVMMGAGFINMIILKEKRDRTFHRICSAPVNARQYIAANAITSLLVVILQIIMIQLVMKFVFRIDTGVSDVAMFVILLLFGLVAVGIGLVVAAFSSSSYIAGTLNTLILTPTCMLGGCFWDISQMPDVMQKISYFVPQRWALNAIQKLQAGGSQGDIAINLLILGAFAAAFMLVAVYRFARTSSVQKFV